MDAVHTEMIGNAKIEIFRDEDAESPRDWDNIGTIFAKHRCYSFEDSKKDIRMFFLDAENEDKINPRNCWGKEEVYNSCGEKVNVCILPLYLLDHSGLRISCNSFNDPWDSGLLGFIYATEDTLKDEKITNEEGEVDWEKAKECLQEEIKTLDQYLCGDVYGFQITYLNPLTGEEEDGDSCWGFYGEENCLEEAKANVKTIDEDSLNFDLSEAN